MTDRQFKQFIYLHSKGHTDREIARKMCVAKYTVQSWRWKYGLKSNTPANGPRAPSKTICWTCQNACGGCSWSKSFLPVEGWEAEPHTLYANDSGHAPVQSYEVLCCPEYLPDRRGHNG